MQNQDQQAIKSLPVTQSKCTCSPPMAAYDLRVGLHGVFVLLPEQVLSLREEGRSAQDMHASTEASEHMGK